MKEDERKHLLKIYNATVCKITMQASWYNQIYEQNVFARVKDEFLGGIKS